MAFFCHYITCMDNLMQLGKEMVLIVSVYEVRYSVMPDLRSLPRTLIRGHPESLEKTGFRLEFTPLQNGAGMTPSNQNRSLWRDTN